MYSRCVILINICARKCFLWLLGLVWKAVYGEDFQCFIYISYRKNFFIFNQLKKFDAQYLSFFSDKSMKHRVFIVGNQKGLRFLVWYGPNWGPFSNPPVKYCCDVLLSNLQYSIAVMFSQTPQYNSAVILNWAFIILRIAFRIPTCLTGHEKIESRQVTCACS